MVIKTALPSLNLQHLSICLISIVFSEITLDSVPTLAQSIISAPDNAGTVVNTSDNRFDITGGKFSGDGTNQFHSFSQFNLTPGQIANFIATPNLRNILGRVTGGDASLINGLIQITGGNSNLYLMNPAGIIFGSNAQLNIPASFTATTATGINFGANNWFNATGWNNYQALVGNPSSFAFNLSQPGSLVNLGGNLSVGKGQDLALIGGMVLNTGTLTAPDGNLTIAAVPGSSLVRISQLGHLLSLEINPTQTSTTSQITPLSIPQLLTGNSVIDTTGVSVNNAGQLVLTDGTILPSAGGSAIASGTLDVSGATGGSVMILGDRVGLFGTNINASGINGGGNVLIGGDYQGKGTVPNATRTFVSSDSIINADAINTGNGGRVIVWADQANRFLGTITARGGSQSGNGGFVEVSGKEYLDYRGNVNTTAANGNAGMLLLDPTNITVINGSGDFTSLSQVDSFAAPNVGANTIDAALINNAATNVTLQATNNITFSAPVTMTNAGVGLTALANSNINVDADITTNDGNLILTADADNTNGGGLTIRGAKINTGAGIITLTGTGIDGTTGNIGGDGIRLDNSQVITISGDITFRGTGGTGGGGTNGSNGGNGIVFNSNSNITSTSGAVNLYGRGGNGGIGFGNPGITNPLPPPTYITNPTPGNGGNGGIAIVLNDNGYIVTSPSKLVIWIIIPGGLGNSRGDFGGISGSNGVNQLQSANFQLRTIASISVSSGDFQTADINTAFATPLQVTVRDQNNNPIPNISVSFTVPSVGASGSLGTSTTLLTDASGMVTNTLIANNIGGSYTVASSISGTGISPVYFDLTNNAPLPIPTPTPTPIPIPTPTPTPIVPPSLPTEIVNIPQPEPLQSNTPQFDNKSAFEIDTVVAERDEAMTRTFEEYLGITANTKAADLSQARKSLQDTEKSTRIKSALIYVIFVPASASSGTNRSKQDNDQLELLLVTSQGQPIRKRIPGATRTQILKVTRTFQKTVTDIYTSRGFLAPAQKLYNWIIAPLEAELQAQGIQNLAFITDTGLRSLPIAALHDGKQFLIENYSLSLMPSLSLTDTRYVDIKNAQVLAMGADNFTNQNKLPAVPVELATITQKIRSGREFLNEEFTVDNLKAQRSQLAFSIIHLATHGKFNSGELANSYIQFWDKQLRLDQIGQLGLNKPPVELLVLSACESALGNEKAELGFAGFAVKAGVKSALASLWSVSDDGTLGLMTGFYDQLKTAPIKAEALRQVQLAMLKEAIRIEGEKLITPGIEVSLPPTFINRGDKSFAHPYYWAAFTLIGSPW